MPLTDKDALREYKRQYYEAHKAEIAIKQKAYREANRAAILSRQKAWCEENADKVSGYKRKWNEANQDKRYAYNSRPDVKARASERGKEHYRQNPEHYKQRAREWREKNPGRKSYSDWAGHLRRSYGITPEQYDMMLRAQGGRCRTCKRPESESAKGRLVVDHMHCSGKVRSLLCSQCNVVIGLARESAETLDALAEYVREFRPFAASTAPATSVA